MKIVTLGTPLGLGFASGLNAYLPLLSFAIAVRWLHLYHVNPNFAFITQDWFIILLAILTIVDFVANKIPLIDHAWDATHTVIRPITGAIVAAASANQPTAPGIIFGVISADHPLEAGIAANGLSLASFGLLIVLLLGGILAFLSHTAKTTTRLVSTITTAGFLNPVLSILEDGVVFIVILLSLFAPVIMLILIILFLVILGPHLLHIRRSRGPI